MRPKIFLGITSILLLLSGFSHAQNNDLLLKTKEFQLKLNEQGFFTSFYDLVHKKEYISDIQSSPLVTIRTSDEIETPTSLKHNSAFLLTLKYNKSGVVLTIKYKVKPTHIVFEITDIEPKSKVDFIYWGPYAVSINKIVGEIIGVVRNDDYAIGIQSLNVKTVGGRPVKDEGFENSRGLTAESKDWGSLLQAYSIDRSKKRYIAVWNDSWPNMPVEPVKGETIIGSKIALFGCNEKNTLTRIGEIEVAEGLPHPLIDGVWSKISPQTGRSYLIADFSEENFDELLGYTKRANLITLYHMDLFQTWGHYEINKKFFPGGVETLKKCVEKAKAEGIRVGAHTLTNFINTDDPYITPIPDKRLVKTGYGKLVNSIGADDKEIQVASPEYFDNEKANNLHTVVIDNELIRYRAVTPTAPYKLLDCVRGAFGTKPESHNADAVVAKLADHGYQIFFPNIPMQREIAINLAKRYNETGLSQMDFDGHEGCGATGQGDYAIDLFAYDFYTHLDHTVINGTSNSKHFYWHINTYCNWGEPWSEGFRESAQSYRIQNQPLLERNFLPKMLGWYLLTANTTLADMEWMLARGSGYNAGFALATNIEALRNNPSTGKILDAIKEWEYLRSKKAFSAKQTELMRDPKTEFHLEKAGEGTWNLYQFHFSDQYVYEKTVRQPGEPLWDEWNYQNPDSKQPLQFRLTASGEGVTIKNPVFEIDNFITISYNVELKNNESLLCEGNSEARVYDAKGKQIKIVKASAAIPDMAQGSHKIKFNCEFSSDKPAKASVVFKSMGAAEQVILK